MIAPVGRVVHDFFHGDFLGFGLCHNYLIVAHVIAFKDGPCRSLGATYTDFSAEIICVIDQPNLWNIESANPQILAYGTCDGGFSLPR